jgi:DNA-binding response OmpR family regulator
VIDDNRRTPGTERTVTNDYDGGCREGQSVSHILIHDPRNEDERWRGLVGGPGRDLVVCENRRSVVSALAGGRPDVLIYVLADLPRDLDLLFELRRVAATLPIILLEGPTDLPARRHIQELRPTYYGISPLENDELSEAVSGALRRAAG